MRQLMLPLLLVLFAGCKPADRAGSADQEAMMQGKPASYWIQQLKSSDAELKKIAARLLKEHGIKDPTVMDELIQTLKGDDIELKLAVCNVLGDMDWYGEAAWDTLTAMLNDKNEKVNMAAGVTLSRINPDRAAKLGIPRSAGKKKSS